MVEKEFYLQNSTSGFFFFSGKTPDPSSEISNYHKERTDYILDLGENGGKVFSFCLP